MRLIRFLSLAALVLSAIACGGQAPAEYPVSTSASLKHSFSTGGTPMVVVENFSGGVRIQGTSDPVVRASVMKLGRGESVGDAEALLNAVNVEFRQEGNLIRVISKQAETAEAAGSAEVEVLLSVPVASDLSLETGLGNIDVRDVTASVVAQSGGGDLRIMGGAGVINASTVSGSIFLQPSGVATVTARTGNGDVNFVGRLGDGVNSFEAVNGSVSLVLPNDASFLLDALSQNGRITSEFDVDGQTSTETHVRGQVGENDGASLMVRAVNGSVHLGQSNGTLGLKLR